MPLDLTQHSQYIAKIRVSRRAFLREGGNTGRGGGGAITGANRCGPPSMFYYCCMGLFGGSAFTGDEAWAGGRRCKGQSTVAACFPLSAGWLCLAACAILKA